DRRSRADQQFAFQAKRRERDELGGAVMQVGPEAPQEPFVEGGGALRRLLDPLMQRLVLFEQRRQLAYPPLEVESLAVDRAACPQDRREERREDDGDRRGHRSPADQERGPQR